jgi:hypothetical protein
MSITTTRDRDRDRVNALYDSACELLIAARQMERDSARDGIAPGLPPVLGCLQDALAALAGAVHEMSADALMHAAGTLADDEFVAISRTFGDLRNDLDAARRRSDAVRVALVRCDGSDR